MEKLFGMDAQELIRMGGFDTAAEIYRQPVLWKETVDIIRNKRDIISDHLSERLKDERLRIILTGAGSSAYVGDTAAPYLSKLLNRRVESIPTTDIVSNPEEYLISDIPTIVLSFARSGNSPESVAVYNLADQIVENISQIIITCNEKGNLANRAKEKDNNLVLLMPEDSNDKGFAMTSSFSCMLLTSLLIFDINNLDRNIKLVEKIIINGQHSIINDYEELFRLVKLGYTRLVHIGPSALRGMSREASLKNLELTSGKAVSMSESVLGFRHGPKSIIDDKTLVFIYLSSDKYTRKYDLDLLKEIRNDGGENKIVAVTYVPDEEVEKYAHKVFVIDRSSSEEIEDAYAALNYIVYGQMFAYFYSLYLGITPDNPRPDGTVNRVVKGVNIYNYNK